MRQGKQGTNTFQNSRMAARSNCEWKEQMDYAEGKYIRDKTHSGEASDLQLVRNGQTSQTYLEQSGASIVDERSINSFIQGVG